ncbi:hypothetical protein HQ489_03475 [Candidatus Woesearchaeota archaeon]|nr:hypothetical protein [Candidatus Woesearchaeota archaeon]
MNNPTTKEGSFLHNVEGLANAAYNVIRHIRLDNIPANYVSIETLPTYFADHKLGDADPQLVSKVVEVYLRQVPTDVAIGRTDLYDGRTSPDVVQRNVSKWAIHKEKWQRDVYTAQKKVIDDVVDGRVKRLRESLVQDVAKELYPYQFSTFELSDAVNRGMPLDGELAPIAAVLKEEMYRRAGLQHHEDPAMMYDIAFRYAVKEKGWDKLDDEKLFSILDAEHITELFEIYFEKDIAKPEPLTDEKLEAWLQEPVTKKKQRISGVVNGTHSAVDWDRDVPRIYTTVNERVRCYGKSQAQFRRNSDESSLHTIDAQGNPRIATMSDIFRARVEDYDTIEGRTLEQRTRLWNQYFYTSTDIIYKGGTSEFKLTHNSPHLAALPENFNGPVFDVECDSVKFNDDVDVIVNKPLTRGQFLASPVWDYLIFDTHVKKRIAEIMFDEFKFNTAFKFWTTTAPIRDHGRALFASNANMCGDVHGKSSLSYGLVSFLRVSSTETSRKP